MSEFVLELGVEEVPARFLPPALAQIEEKGAELLREARLGWDSLVALGTPRRLILRVTGLPSRQEAREVKVKGPARRVAFDEAGRPTRAALGFAASQGVTADQLRVEEIPGGEYVFALRREEGRPTGEVLGGVAAELLARLEFPRSMRWGQGDYRFVRPVRWIVALLDEEVVPFEFAGVASGRVTWGHRSLHPGCREIRAAHEFLSALRELGVVADPGERKESIREQTRSAARELGGEVLADEELLEEVTFLVEHPTALGGTFASDYLALPAAVPVTVLKHHQRCFSLVRPRSGAETGAQPGGGDRQVELLPGFVAVRDGGPQFLEVVREGYQRVVRARLADAAFFFAEDLKQSLERWGEALAGVGFLEGLGTMAQKAERLETLAQFLAYSFRLDPQLTAVCRRAARLAKADRATFMVRELPELEGIMGREYALRSGEDAAVAQAVREHYLPRFAQDELPASMAGTVVSLADRLDTLVGAFACRLEPTGSQDPYGLRRAAYGLVRILWASGLHLSLGWAVEEAQAAYAQVLGRTEMVRGEAAQEVRDSLLEFLRGRVRNLFGEQGIRPDLIDVVMEKADDVTDAWERARALNEVKDYPEFAEALAAFRRVVTLARKAEDDAVDPRLLREPAEREMWRAYQAAEGQAREQAEAGDWRRFLACVAALRPYVDNLLDRVLIMAPEEDLRRNRLALLQRLARLFCLIGDLSRVVAL